MDNFEPVEETVEDEGSVTSVVHEVLSKKESSKHGYINEILLSKRIPLFLKMFYYYLIIFFFCLISGASIFLYYVYPSLSKTHAKTLHLDIVQDLKRSFLNVI